MRYSPLLFARLATDINFLTKLDDAQLKKNVIDASQWIQFKMDWYGCSLVAKLSL